MKHELKCEQPFFDAIYCGAKNFEVRSAHDRLFLAGDTLVLREEPDTNRPPIVKIVSYILKGGQFGIAPGYVVMALRDPVGPKEEQV
jgi:hypothetical protein